MSSESDPFDFGVSRSINLHSNLVFDSLLNRLNFHHLYYFWVVATLGSIRRGSDHLLLSPPTVSRQIKELESKLQIKLFSRSNQNVELTAEGEQIRILCDELFGIATQLVNGISPDPKNRRMSLTVGVAGAIPKLTVFKILGAAVHLKEPVQIICSEVSSDKLTSYLSKSLLDIILADFPTDPQHNFGPSCHLIAESPIVACGSALLAKRYRKDFPASLDTAPVLLPAAGSSLRVSLDQYFRDTGTSPNVLGEFDDSTMLKFFGEAGHGLFFVPAAITSEVKHRHRCEVVGKLEGVLSRYYAIVSHRTIKNPVTVAILEAARQTLASDRTT